MPHGCVRGDKAIAYQGDMLSTPACHLGGFLGFFGWPICRYRRIAMTSRTTPSAILTASDARVGAVFCFGGLFPVARTVTATTTASERNHPATKNAPL